MNEIKDIFLEIPEWVRNRAQELVKVDLRSLSPELFKILEIVERDSSLRFADYSSLTMFLYTYKYNSDFLKHFVNLPENQKPMLLADEGNFNTDEMATFVLTLKESRAKGDFLMKADLSNFKEFHEAFKSRRFVSVNFDGYEYDQQSSYTYDFKKLLSNIPIVHNTKRSGPISLLFLLREIYGETAVIDVMTRRNSENKKLPMLEVLRLLKNWNEIKDYPLDWALEIAGK